VIAMGLLDNASDVRVPGRSLEDRETMTMDMNVGIGGARGQSPRRYTIPGVIVVKGLAVGF
ncbi:MAG: hypothetical protein ABEK84_06045, partial [Salinibacter sp.]